MTLLAFLKAGQLSTPTQIGAGSSYVFAKAG